MSVTVSEAQENDQQRWQSYVDQHSDSNLAHRWEWRTVIEQSFGHRPYYLLASNDQKIVGVLPLFHVQSFLFGSALISMPYLNGGGALANDRDVHQALVERAKDLAQQLKADYLELRYHAEVEDLNALLIRKQHKVSVVLPLRQSSDQMFQALPAKLRSQIRRPTKDGVEATSVTGSDNVEDAITKFYSVFAEHMRDLGTPVYPRKFFELVARGFKDRCRIHLAQHNQNAISAGITLAHRDQIEIPWAASLRKFNRLSPNMLLYWTAMETACTDGYRSFDFGRSSLDSKTLAFKKQWGGTEVPLNWYYHLERGEVPQISPQNPKFSLAIRLWKQLPLSVTNCIGPWIARGLP